MRRSLVTLLVFCTFYALAQTEPAVTSLTLVNAATSEPVGELVDGLTLDLTAIGTDQLSVVANTRPDTVGSVVFAFDGDADYQVESVAPYTIAGDGTQDGAVTYNPWTPSAGEHVLTATPYSGPSGGGNPGAALTIRFTVVNEAQAVSDAATPEAATPATPPQTETTTEPSSGADAVTVEQPTPAPSTLAPSAPTTPLSATARVRQERFELTPAPSTLRGSVLVADYGLAQTILTVLVSGTSATESYTAAVYEGGCEGAAVPLEPINGRTGLSASAVALSFDELVRGNYYLGIDSAAGQQNGLSCTRLGGQ